MFCATCKRECETEYVPDYDEEGDWSVVWSVCCHAPVFQDAELTRPYTVADCRDSRAGGWAGGLEDE